MLRTNSKQARNNLKKWILENIDFSNYNEQPEQGDELKAIYQTFINEYYHGGNYQKSFCDWLQGLPSIGLGDFFVRNSKTASDILADILEETEEEKNRYTIEKAENMLSNLIYMEITRA